MKADIKALDALFEAHDRDDRPGLIVAAAVDGHTVYRRAFGMAAVHLGCAMTPRTRMRIGSTSKQFTALAVLLLVEDGLLGLDAPVRSYLPELPVYPFEPTVRQLLWHTGGIRDHVSDAMLIDGARSVKPAGWTLRHLLRQSALNSAPGQRWLYSNGGYHLLSHLVERVSGRPFGQFLSERIFQPLGMADTELVQSDLDIVPGLATLHTPAADGSWMRGVFPHEDMLGEGGIVSTADDMLRWLAELRSPRRLGRSATWERMKSRARLADGSEHAYGMGLLHLDMQGVPVLQHAGAVIGASCQAVAVPSHGIDIVVMSNGLAVSPTALAGQVLGVLLGGSAAPAQDAVRPRSADYAALLGQTYRAPSGMVLSFEAVGEILGVAVLGNSALPLRIDREGLVLAFEDAGSGPFRFRGAAPGMAEPPPSLVVLEGSFEEQHLLVAAGDKHDDGEACGRYRCDDLGTEAQWDSVDGVATLQISGGANRLALRLERRGADLYHWRSIDARTPLTGMLHLWREGGKVGGLQMDAWGSRGLRYDRVTRHG